jgi:anti-sigma regulatory factor (Ser/Thr protein kinase)
MAAHQVFEVHEASQVGEARRGAVLSAGRLGLDEASCGRLALVITELGTNLVRHAVGGRLLVARRDGPAGPSIEILSLDRGPGMNDLEHCLRDGYSTSSTPGTGFGAVRRLADEFAAFSCAPGGTVIFARVAQKRGTRPAAPAQRFHHGSVSVAATGETQCGDAWSLVQRDGQAAVLMVDGLGHGPEAERAALACVAAFEAAAFDAPEVSLARAHAAMRSTRGAAAAIAQLDIDADTVAFCGVGNIAARLTSGVEDRSFLCQHGTLGLQFGRLQEVKLPWPKHALFVMHSDGIPTRWDLRRAPGLLQSDPAVIAGWLIRDHLDGRDDATVIVVRVAARESA